MAIKKSELYSSLWSSCDELRGGMDASQYKDYVLVMLFVKYISDKYAGIPYSPVTIPEGATFKDMVALKGTSNIGDDINKKIIGPIAEKNHLSDMPDFNDVNKLGSGKEMVDRLTNLIAIFERRELDFSKNRADGDDILGDAYEYLMRHFATESGKSKGQFYTPAEVSRIIAKIIGINPSNVNAQTTVYDPTCGSGSLLLKVSDEAGIKISLYGQEKDSATTGLARMNMYLHDNPLHEIKQGNTLANPMFKDANGRLKTFDYVVANPPFSDKRWGNGVDAEHDEFERFKDYGVPPAKNGDFAYLLHIIRSLKSGKGKGACILPHGVLFRGNAEAEIRKNLIRKGYIKGIIGLPANLFYGTGIPACIIVLDKENAVNRKGIFMIDASKGFMKDGNKNRLRHMDIHKIVDVFNNQIEIDKYSKMVPFSEIEKNEYNLNIPRYIDSQEAEDIQDIEAHLSGGIPKYDIDALNEYWEVCPNLKEALFSKSSREKYFDLKVEKDDIKNTIHKHKEFKAFSDAMETHFKEWKVKHTDLLKGMKVDLVPKKVIFELSESILAHYKDTKLISKYDVYQHLMDFWDEIMQDDCYMISVDGWKAETYRILIENKQKKLVDKGWTCDLVPKELVINRYFYEKKQDIDMLETECESVVSQIAELEEEHSGEEGYFAELEKVNKASVQARLKEVGKDAKDERKVLEEYLELCNQEAELNRKIKDAKAELDNIAYEKYPKLTEDEIKVLVVEDKWMAVIEKDVHSQMDSINQRLTQRIKELAERYEKTLMELDDKVKVMEEKVKAHLERMGL
ncbi:MAG TPA: type I restriction-modification system subunit M [Pseudobacteroides sp.]|uniref:type I restriction-modification system subunit M n=1 Tax=Pseudobacteroides sp. TaxID=1968840 RepID=UPI002F92B7BC